MGGAIIDMRWRAGRIVSLDLHSKSEGAIRLIPPQAQAVAGIRTPEGEPLLVGKDGTIRLTKGISYSVTFR
jgi:hypothetical protein